MQNISVTINSNRKFQRELEDALRKEYPKIKPSIFIREAFDAFQTTTLAIAGATLLIEIIQLITSIQKHHPDSKTEVELKVDKTGKTLKIDATDVDINIEKIVGDFLSNEEK